MLAGDFELVALVARSPEEARILDGQGRLGGEGLEQVDGGGREVAGRVPGHGQAAEQASSRSSGTAEHGPDPGAISALTQPALVGSGRR